MQEDCRVVVRPAVPVRAWGAVPATVAALRQAISQIAPAALPAFTRELDQAADQSRQGADLSPLQRFIAQWAVYVHIQRRPEVAADLRRWEDIAEAGEVAKARQAASEIGRILDEAHAAVDLAAAPSRPIVTASVPAPGSGAL